MFKKILAELFCHPCDLCGEKKWNMIVSKRNSYRGPIVRRTCTDCTEKIEQKHAEKIRRQWF